jgi:hypothetical protein
LLSATIFARPYLATLFLDCRNRPAKRSAQIPVGRFVFGDDAFFLFRSPTSPLASILELPKIPSLLLAPPFRVLPAPRFVVAIISQEVLLQEQQSYLILQQSRGFTTKGKNLKLYARLFFAFASNISFFTASRFFVLWLCDICLLIPEFLFAIGTV